MNQNCTLRGKLEIFISIESFIFTNIIMPLCVEEKQVTMSKVRMNKTTKQQFDQNLFLKAQWNIKSFTKQNALQVCSPNYYFCHCLVVFSFSLWTFAHNLRL